MDAHAHLVRAELDQVERVAPERSSGLAVASVQCQVEPAQLGRQIGRVVAAPADVVGYEVAEHRVGVAAVADRGRCDGDLACRLPVELEVEVEAAREARRGGEQVGVARRS